MRLLVLAMLALLPFRTARADECGAGQPCPGKTFGSASGRVWDPRKVTGISVDPATGRQKVNHGGWVDQNAVKIDEQAPPTAVTQDHGTIPSGGAGEDSVLGTIGRPGKPGDEDFYDPRLHATKDAERPVKDSEYFKNTVGFDPNQDYENFRLGKQDQSDTTSQKPDEPSMHKMEQIGAHLNTHPNDRKIFVNSLARYQIDKALDTSRIEEAAKGRVGAKPTVTWDRFKEAFPPKEERSDLAAEVKQEDAEIAQTSRDFARGQRGPRREAGFQVAGDNSMRAGRPERAEEDYRGALEVNPRNERARTGHALALAQLGRTDEARKEAAPLAAANPRNQVAAMVAGHAGQLDRSGGVVKKAAKFVNGLWAGPSAEKVQDQGDSISDGGPLRQAEASNMAAIQAAEPARAVPAEPSVVLTPLLPPPSMAHYKEAFGKLQVRDMTGALFEATASINDAPNAAAPWVLRAYIDNRLTPEPNPKGAVSDAGQALKIEPQNAAALREKALGELTQGQAPQALTDLAAAISLDPKNGTGYLYRAMANEKLGKASDAAADYNQAASLDPALTPFANQALERLGGAKFAKRWNASGLSPRNRKLLRGGLIGLALIMILAGMLGTEAGRKLITQRAVFTTNGARFERALASSRPLSTGEVIGGNYRVERELGRGGMGIVYRALDLALQRPVAVKQLQRTESATADDLERFLREARLVAKLRNPRLVEIYNVINEGDLFLVFEYMDGKSLDRVLGSRRRLSLPEVHQALADVGAAVDYAHAQNVIHRDLKPANVMVEQDGRCKVMDFGIAHQSQAATFLTQTVASGTPPYMAPEQAFGSVSKASDLYAMGVMAYEMATGRRPFAGPDYVEQKLRREFGTVTNDSLPASLDAFFHKALDPDPTKRFESAAQLLQGFRAACAAQPV